MSDAKSNILNAGSILGRYELLLPIAKGGMAQVWAARLRGTRGFQKLVAIKTILADVMDNTRMEQMFLEEATLASQIHDPNVVQTLELGEQDGTLYLVMEWVDGEPLNQLMSRSAEKGGMPLPIAVNLIGQACGGLQAAHDLRDDSGALLGVVHRDVSPQNLLVSYSGTAKLVDFGIAKVAARSSGLTQAGEVKGKFAYMAPEQVRGLGIDARTDLFSLGILLYAVTTGKHPFRGAHPGETLQNICSGGSATPPSAFMPDYPMELEQVVLKALQKQPEQRYGSAREMLTALNQAFPSALVPGFDSEVAEYMKQVFGAKASERRAAIRNAQLDADRQRQDAGASSVGTLRAISISQEGGEFSLVPTPVPSSSPAAEKQAQTTSPRSRRIGSVVVAAAAVIGLGAVLQLGRGPATSVSAAASSPVPKDLVSLEHVTAPSAVTSVLPPPASATPPPLAPSASGERSAKASRAPRAAAVPKLQSAGTPPSLAATAIPLAASKKETPPAASINAWDRGAFGGRH